MRPQRTVQTDGKEVILDIKGRHDVCVVPRVIPIVEAMTAMVIADLLLYNNIYKNL